MGLKCRQIMPQLHSLQAQKEVIISCNSDRHLIQFPATKEPSLKRFWVMKGLNFSSCKPGIKSGGPMIGVIPEILYPKTPLVSLLFIARRVVPIRG